MQFLEEHLPHSARDRVSTAAPDGIYQLLKVQLKDMIFQSEIESSELWNLLFSGAELSPLLVFPTCQREISTFTGRGNLKALSVGGKKEEGEAASGLIGEGWLHLGAPQLGGSSCPQILASSCRKTCAVLGKYKRVMSSLPGSLCGLHRGPGISGKLFQFEFKLQFYNLISSYRVQ